MGPIVRAAAALTAAPPAFGGTHIDRLREVGLSELEIADLIQATAFFNWANRLMLSIARPVAPAEAQP